MAANDILLICSPRTNYWIFLESRQRRCCGGLCNLRLKLPADGGMEAEIGLKLPTDLASVEAEIGLKLPTDLASVEAEIEKSTGARFFLNLIHPRREVVGVFRKDVAAAHRLCNLPGGVCAVPPTAVESPAWRRRNFEERGMAAGSRLPLGGWFCQSRQWRERCKRDLGYDEGNLFEHF